MPYVTLHPRPTHPLVPFAAAPAAAPLTTAEEDGLRRALAANDRRVRRLGLAVVPVATAVGAVLARTYFAFEPTSGAGAAGSVALLLCAVGWNAVVVWALWEEALAAVPGPAVPFETPRTVEGLVTPDRETWRPHRRGRYRVRFPSHWPALAGRVQMRLVEPPRRRGPGRWLGQSPLVLDATAAPRSAAAPPPVPPSATSPPPGPPAGRARGRWRWDRTTRTLGLNPSPAPSVPLTPSAVRASPAPSRPDASLAEDLASGIEVTYPLS